MSRTRVKKPGDRKRCSVCEVVYSLDMFSPNGRGGLRADCKLCHTRKQQARRRKDPEKYRERTRLAMRALRERDPKAAREKERVAHRAQRARHREVFREAAREEKRSIRRQVLAAYGGKCECCREVTPEFLSIDHVNNDGAEHRKVVHPSNLYRWLRQNGFPKDGFRLLCHNCNFARGHYGSCPHEKCPALKLVTSEEQENV